MLSGEGADLPNRKVNATEDSSVFLKENSGRLRRKLRHFTDKAAKICIAAGGLGVIAALLLIFFYLFYEVMPQLSSESTRVFLQEDGTILSRVNLSIR